MWARFLVELLPRLDGTEFRRAVDVVGPLRMVKDAAEIAALRAAGAAADRVADQLHAGDIPLVGRTEAQVSADISARLLAEGHDKVNFAIVAAGENAASPHHHAGDRVIARRRDRAVRLRRHDGRVLQRHHALRVHGRAAGRDRRRLRRAPRGAAGRVASATVGTPCQDVDRTARRIIADAGFGDYFVHRTGHGIGMEEHEDPYIVEGNERPLVAGHAFSVEPGIYVPGRWGMRLEDIVVATDGGPEAAQRLGPRPRRRLTVGGFAAGKPRGSHSVSGKHSDREASGLVAGERRSSGSGEYAVSSMTTSAASRRASAPSSRAQ